MPHGGVRILQSESCADAIVEFLLHRHGELFYRGVGTVGGVGILAGEIGLGRFRDHIAELRSCLKEETTSLSLSAPHELCHYGQLDVVDAAVILLSLARCSYDWFRLEGDDILAPSHLGVVEFGIDRADGLEVFLARISKRQSARESRFGCLRHLRCESHAGHHVTRIHSYGEVIAIVAYLCLRLLLHEERHEEDEEESSDWICLAVVSHICLPVAAFFSMLVSDEVNMPRTLSLRPCGSARVGRLCSDSRLLLMSL